MRRTDFLTALQDVDRDLGAAGIPPHVERRLQQRLREAHSPPRRRAAYVLTFAAAAAAVLLVWFARRGPHQPAVVAAARLGMFEVGAASPDLVTQVDAARGEVRIETGTCSLVEPELGITFRNAGPLALGREQNGTRVLRGRVDVQVRPRRDSEPPVRIIVSHGSIEVVGTHFTIDQDEDGGTVALHDGSIRFMRIDGQIVSVAPGQTLAWPEPTPAAEALAPAPTTAVSLGSSDRPSVAEQLEYIQGLRSRGQYDRAAQELAKLLREPLPAATRERLSYERGSLLTRQLGGGEAACRHWHAHQTAYPRGRYDAEITRLVIELKCPDGLR